MATVLSVGSVGIVASADRSGWPTPSWPKAGHFELVIAAKKIMSDGTICVPSGYDYVAADGEALGGSNTFAPAAYADGGLMVV